MIRVWPRNEVVPPNESVPTPRISFASRCPVYIVGAAPRVFFSSSPVRFAAVQMASDECDNLLYDQACLQVSAHNSSDISLWTQTEECYKVSYFRVCPFGRRQMTHTVSGGHYWHANSRLRVNQLTFSHLFIDYSFHSALTDLICRH